jgi:hypothetical protein
MVCLLHLCELGEGLERPREELVHPGLREKEIPLATPTATPTATWVGMIATWVGMTANLGGYDRNLGGYDHLQPPPTTATWVGMTAPPPPPQPGWV